MNILPQPHKIYGTVYCLTNMLNGKMYVGQTIRTIEARWARHISDAIVGRQRGCSAIQRAIRKYGPDSFDIEVIATCDSKKELDQMEAITIETRNTLTPNGYNLKTGGANGRPSDETRSKLSKALRGEKNPFYRKSHSDETRQRISKANSGKSPSAETRAKISEAGKRRISSPETCAKRSESLKKYYQSPEMRSKISAANKGRPKSPEHRAKLSKANMGKSPSSETRAKMSATRKGRKHGPPSPETCAKISAANKGHIPWNKGIKGKPLSPEHRAKLSVARRRRMQA